MRRIKVLLSSDRGLDDYAKAQARPNLFSSHENPPMWRIITQNIEAIRGDCAMKAYSLAKSSYTAHVGSVM